MPLDAARVLDFANAIGNNALTFFAGALMVLLAFVACLWHFVHRVDRSSSVLVAAAASNQSRALAFAFTTVVVAVPVFSLVPAWFVPNGTLTQADQAMTDAMQRSVSASTVQVFAAVTLLANTPVLWAIAIAGALILLSRRDYALAAVWIASIAGNGILTRVLKAAFERTRPVYDQDLLTLHGYSFPSGHSSGAVATYGALAYVLVRSTPQNWHLPIVLSATATAFVIGSSRFFLRAHYASDVFAGFVSGLAWLCLCVMCAEMIRSARRQAHARVPAQR